MIVVCVYGGVGMGEEGILGQSCREVNMLVESVVLERSVYEILPVTNL